MNILVRLIVLFVITINSACAVDKQKTSDLATNAGVGVNDENIYQSWQKKCQIIANKDNVCLIYQNYITKKSGKVLLSVSFSYTGSDNHLVASFKLPLGMFLPSGLVLKVDDNEKIDFVIQTCLPDGCYASINIERNVLNEFKLGQEVKVGFKTMAQRQVVVKLSLKGFKAAIDSLDK
ncbi:MAG: invasion associated locus B family protein [Methylococcaceae bacterium]